MIDTTLIEWYLSHWPKRDVTTMSDKEFDEILEAALSQNASYCTDGD